MTLLIVGDPEDLTSAYVRFRAEERAIRVCVLDESSFGHTWQVEFVEYHGTALHSERDVITFANGQVLQLADVSGAYVRFTPTPDVPSCLQSEPLLAETYARERRAAIHALLNQLAVPVVNTPGCGQANGSKPLQMAQLVQAGFEVPAWIASNQAATVRAFVTHHPGGAVIKSCSGTRSEVQVCSNEMIERLAAGSTPVIVQARIEGFDVRVHTVGQEAFATAIDAGPGVDYRFDETQPSYRTYVAPPAIIARCCRFAAQQGLLLAGFDFRVDSTGRWWCLECNPAPTFLPYEMSTGQPIANALMDLIYTQ